MQIIFNRNISNGKDGDKFIKEFINESIRKNKANKILLVCDNAYEFLNIKDDVENVDIPMVRFSNFKANPLYEEVCEGVGLLNEEKCDFIIAIGGGSALDVAKCIKLYATMDHNENYLKQECLENNIPILAIPTTAGTGSESTRFAVIYYKGEKQSVSHQSIIPQYVLLDSSVLKTLPLYQKKSTLLDAFCQAIESWWSVNSTDESKRYSKYAIENIMKYNKAYLDGDEYANEEILKASNYAGQAINITQTTAAHAMSYKITSIFGLAHGHAVALCLPKVWRCMIENIELCCDPRGKKYVQNTFEDIAKSLGVRSIEEAVEVFENIIEKFELDKLEDVSEENINTLVESVNPVRLKNNPIELNKKLIREIYEIIGSGE